jgi:hypothetical protein
MLLAHQSRSITARIARGASHWPKAGGALASLAGMKQFICYRGLSRHRFIQSPPCKSPGRAVAAAMPLGDLLL